MLRFFTDAELKRPVSKATPKKLIVPDEGGVRSTRLYLGDPDAQSGTVYETTGDIRVAVTGGSAVGVQRTVAVRLKRTDQVQYGFPGTPAIFVGSTLNVDTPLAVDVQFAVDPGNDAMFEFELLSGPFKVQGSADAPALVTASCQAIRANQGQVQRVRVLPPSRAVRDSLPGIVVGEHRWRDDTTTNAIPLVPARWDVNPTDVGVEKFVAGIGDGDDLEPVSVEESESSIFLRVHQGQYFTGPNRHFLPAGHMLEIFRVGEELTYTLKSEPRRQSPLFVGTWQLLNGFYEPDKVYRYVGHEFRPDEGDPQFTLARKLKTLTLSEIMPQRTLLLGAVSGLDVDHFELAVYPIAGVRSVYVDRGPNLPPLPASAFTFDQSEGTVDVPKITGALVGQPVYAVCDPAVVVLYEQDGTWTALADYPEGAIIVHDELIQRALNAGKSGTTQPSFSRTADAATLDNEITWVCEGPRGTRRLPVDLNPAFAGIGGGIVYLQHRRQKAASVVLSCDKPRADVHVEGAPLDQVAYGPVFFNGDYALLSATALDEMNQTVPGILLDVIPGENFQGLLNYRDPVATPLRVRTGGDGTVNLIYTPPQGYGQFVPLANIATTNLANDTLVLPTPVPFSKLYADGAWLVTTYSVFNDNGLYGKAGANPALGEIPFVETGAGATYRSNGLKYPWQTPEGKAAYPIAALDTAGKLHSDPDFNGSVEKLVYGGAAATVPPIASAFIAYIEQSVTLKLQAAGSSIFSNSILLQTAPPPAPVIDQNPWLILDDVANGRLGQYRLGWSHQFEHTPMVPIIKGSPTKG